MSTRHCRELVGRLLLMLPALWCVLLCVLQSPMPAALAQKLQAKKRGNKDRFGGMSVEGRGLVV